MKNRAYLRGLLKRFLRYSLSSPNIIGMDIRNKEKRTQNRDSLVSGQRFSITETW